MNVQSFPGLPACDFTPEPYQGPARATVLETRKKYCNPAVFTIYKEPLMIVDGYMQYLFDESGTRYLDLFAGIATVACGHCHPKIIERTKKQIDRLQHASTIYLHPNLGEFAQRLAEKFPSELSVTYFVNSGSEADDLAMLMARLYTGNYEMLALQNCYHGAISSTMGLTSHHTWKYPIPQGNGIRHVPCPDPYRSTHNGNPQEIALASAEDILNVIRYQTPGKVAGFIAEPIQGVGGVTTSEPAYLQRAYEIVRAHGGVCISDEVQTGFGRTGDNYWGFQNYDVVPDIVTTAKGIGNGIPLAAVTTTREIAEVMTQRIHFNTFGGNPVSMAQGLAVLDIIDEEKLQENAKKVGGFFKKQLLALQEKHQLIGDVRGRGLMLGVELVNDRVTREPATAAMVELMEQTRKRGALFGKGGLFGNVIRIKPPLCITEEDAAFAIDVLDQSLTAITS